MSSQQLWGTEMNTVGFMGLVDKLWILMQRIYMIITIVLIIIIVVNSVLLTGMAQERFRARNVRRNH